MQGVAAGGLMALAMATVGDLVEPRERGRYQGYIAATFAVATVVGPLLGGALVDGASWRWVFLVNLPVGARRAGRPAAAPAGRPRSSRPSTRSTCLGAALLAAATSTLMLACIQAGAPRGLRADPRAPRSCSSAALVVQERRAADPIVPLRLLRTRTVAIVSAALFLATAALFAITVFVPLFLQTTTGATPTEAGPAAGPGDARHHRLDHAVGPRIARTGRYKRFPVAGLGADDGRARARWPSSPAIRRGWPPASRWPCSASASGWSPRCSSRRCRTASSAASSASRPRPTGFFRALGGAVGAAVLGAVFAAQAGAARRGRGAGAASAPT